jgi:hypothetical protein
MLVGVFHFPTDYGIDVGELARELEARGFDSLFVCEHTHIPSRTPMPFQWLPEVGLANVRVRPGPLNSLEVQPGGRTDKHGQFVLAVEESRHNADDLLSRHSRLKRLETLQKRSASTAF